MGNRKRGLQRKDKNFFKSKLVLDSMKSKAAFAFIVLLFGVVIVFAGMDIVDNLSGFGKQIGREC